MSKPRHIAALTGVRGVASFWVLLHHAPNLHPLGELDLGVVEHVVEKGWLGVDLFFVLSGFVISYVYAERMREPSWSGAVRFWKLRLARVYPAHLVTTAAFVAIVGGASVLLNYSSPENRFTLPKLLYALTLTNGFGIPDSQGWNLPSWSVSSEWFAYLCFPLLTLVTGRPRSARAGVVGAVAVLGAMVGLSFAVNGGQNFTLGWSWTLARVTGEFLIGAYLFSVFRHASGERVFDALAWTGLAVVVALSLLGVPPSWDALMIAAFGALVLGLSRAGGAVGRLFSSRPLFYLGEISYSVYLVHSLVIVVLGQFSQRLWPSADAAGTGGIAAIALAYVLGSLAAGHLLFTRVEQPARDWLRKRWIA